MRSWSKAGQAGQEEELLMDRLTAYNVCRVRLACLRAIVDAGDVVVGWQLRRATAPMAGRLTWAPDARHLSTEAQVAQLRAAAAQASADRRGRGLATIEGQRKLFGAVDGSPE